MQKKNSNDRLIHVRKEHNVALNLLSVGSHIVLSWLTSSLSDWANCAQWILPLCMVRRPQQDGKNVEG